MGEVTEEPLIASEGAEVGEAAHADALSARLAELQLLSSADLRTEWRRVFRGNPPSLSRDLLVRALAYKLQEVAQGGLPHAIIRKLAARARHLRSGSELGEATTQIKSGARLIREWRGRTHVVTVRERGYAYAGRDYPSLTRIAQEITGARWSGPRFFGLVKRRRSQKEPEPAGPSAKAAEATPSGSGP